MLGRGFLCGAVAMALVRLNGDTNGLCPESDTDGNQVGRIKIDKGVIEWLRDRPPT